MIYYILALGNCGKKYEKTRHNVGFLMLDLAFPDLEFKSNKLSESMMANYLLDNKKIIFIKPQTYMNLSGKTAKYFFKNDHLFLDNLLVVQDDLYLPFGQTKLSFAKGDGGHNGIKSIVDNLKTNKFARLRIGIDNGFISKKRDSEIAFDNSDFVLDNFSNTEIEKLSVFSKDFREIVRSFVSNGLEKTMNLFN